MIKCIAGELAHHWSVADNSKYLQRWEVFALVSVPNCLRLVSLKDICHHFISTSPPLHTCDNAKVENWEF